MTKTPAEQWTEKIIQYKKNCQKILDISKNIRYVGVINNYGRTLTGIIQPTIKPLLKPEQVKNEFFIISTLMTLRKDSSNSIGELDYVLLRHKKTSIVFFQKISIGARQFAAN